MFQSSFPDHYKSRQIYFTFQVLSFILLFHILGRTDFYVRTTLLSQWGLCGQDEFHDNTETLFMLTCKAFINAIFKWINGSFRNVIWPNHVLSSIFFSSLGSHIAFSCHVSFMTLIWNSFSAFLVFYGIDIFMDYSPTPMKINRMFLIWGFLIFTHD